MASPNRPARVLEPAEHHGWGRAREDSIRAQQNYETGLIKDLLHNWPGYVKLLPEQKDAFDKIAQAAVDKAKTLNDAAVAAVQPVKHTIKIEVTAMTPPPAPSMTAATAPAAAPASAPTTSPATAPAK